jgi:hypothetical protein
MPGWSIKDGFINDQSAHWNNKQNVYCRFIQDFYIIVMFTKEGTEHCQIHY